MDAHIAKPVDPQELAQQLVRWIKPAKVGSVEANNINHAPASSEAEIEALTLALPDVSVRQALARLHGDCTLYRRLLSGFAKQHAQLAATITAYSDNGDTSALFQLAHQLQGEAGNLGLDRLGKAAHRVAASIKQQQREQLPQLAAELAASARQSVAALLDCEALRPQQSDNGATQEEPGLNELLPLLHKLASQLAERNFSAIDSASAIEQKLANSSLAEAYRPISQAAQALNYDVALTALRRWMQDMGW